MAEYTYKDVIIAPTSEEAKNCIGKEVYFADDPTTCLSRANNDEKCFCKILQRTELSDYCPFIIDINCMHWGSIIPKKEEPKPEYVPFDTIEEFVKASLIHNKDHYLAGTGIWIKEPYVDDSTPVCMIMVNGFSTCDNMIFADGIWLHLEEVLNSYTFLDGAPCGKLKEVEE